MSERARLAAYNKLPYEVLFQIHGYLINTDLPVLILPTSVHGAPIKLQETDDFDPHGRRFRIPAVAQVDRWTRQPALTIYLRHNKFHAAIFNMDAKHYMSWVDILRGTGGFPKSIVGYYYLTHGLRHPEKVIAAGMSEWACALWDGKIDSMPTSRLLPSCTFVAEQIVASMNHAGSHRPGTPFTPVPVSRVERGRRDLLKASGMPYPEPFWRAYECTCSGEPFRMDKTQVFKGWYSDREGYSCYDVWVDMLGKRTTDYVEIGLSIHYGGSGRSEIGLFDHPKWIVKQATLF